MFQRCAPWALAIGIIAAGAVWAGARRLDTWRLESSLKAAKAAISARAPAKARGLLTDALARWPEEGEIAFLLGATEFSLGHREAAEAAWSRVPVGSPFVPHAAMYRARLVLEHDRFADAEGLLLIALKGSGKHAIEARETLVKLYKLQGRFDEARALVHGAWGNYPDPSGLLKELEKLGSTYPLGFGVITTALTKAARNAPEDDRIWLGWANLATRTGRLDEAKKRLDDCLQLRPDDAAVWKGWLDLGLGGSGRG